MIKAYMDNGATTKLDEEVAKEMMLFYNERYGNASSLHELGSKAKKGLENAREVIAKKLNASPQEIIFTSGGTESNNLTIKGIAFANKDKGKHIITTKVEHDCVLNACKWLEKQGYEVTYLDVNEEGFIDLEDLKSKIRDDTILVSVIHGNNEIGTIMPVEEIYKTCKEKNVYFHSDACQSFTKVPMDAKNFDLITINAHKIHGPKGVGALYIKKGTKITPLQHGGGQENSLRSGTENVPGAVGFGKAVEISNQEHLDEIA